MLRPFIDPSGFFPSFCFEFLGEARAALLRVTGPLASNDTNNTYTPKIYFVLEAPRLG